MGKSYVENSLKRFLKRKVKITLGVVVTFLITGAVSLGAEPQEPIVHGNGVYIPVNSWLKGIGNQKENILKNNIVVKNDKAQIDFTISKDLINDNKSLMSSEVLNNINNSLELIDKAINKKTDFDENKLSGNNGAYNLGLSGIGEINTEDKTYDKIKLEKENEIHVNKGFLKKTTGNQNHTAIYLGGKNSKTFNYGVIDSIGHGQGLAASDSEAYNFGIILSGNMGQTAFEKSVGGEKNNIRLYNYGYISGAQGIGSDESIAYNYGIISYAKSDGAQALTQKNNQEAHNYGLIKSESNGQSTWHSNGKLKNFGLIISKKNGQYFESGSIDVIGVNYGLIKSERNGQHLNSSNSESRIYNYGVIESQENGQVNAGNNGKSYNYGIIKNSAVNINHAAIKSGENPNDTESKYTENSGLIIADTGHAFWGKVTNNGIVLSKADILENKGANKVDKTTNNGVYIITKDGTTTVEVSDKTENLTDSKKVSEIQKNNIFVNNLNTDSNVTLTVDTPNLDNKHITAVLGKESKADTVVKATDDLIFNNSTVIGYFEKDGTLLEVKGDLTLSGNSVINAIAGNEYTGYTGDALNNVVAVKLSDNGTLTIEENSKVLGLVQGNGTAVLKDNKEHHNKGFDVKELEIKTTQEKGTATTVDNLKVTNGVVIAGSETSKDNTKITFGNNINIVGGISFNEHGTGGNLGADITLGDGQTSSDKTINIENITLGTGDDVLTINNILGKVGEINGNGGNDTVNLKNSTGTHDTFDYKLKNIDTLDLGNSAWKIGENANISHDTITRADGKTTIQNGTLAGELKGTAEKGVEFVNSEAVNSVLGNSTFGDNAKFQMNIGKDMELIAGAEYDIEDKAVENLKNNVGEKNITASAIFTKATEQGKDIRVKTAEEMKIDSRYSGIYEEMLENASSNSEILDTLNSSDVSSIANAVNGKGALGDTLATTGYKITRDISNSFMSAVNEWGKKANKGEWLANAKYINSDVEYDGANKVKGYDSDIKSMVGMIEYGVSDNTSLGIALGGGDTEIDVKDAGTLKGDNYYIGAYAKHSVNGFDLTGNLGYTISDLEVNGEGSADSSAITLGGYVKRDIALTETVRLEPNLSFTYDYIMQDNAEGSGVKADNKDIHVFEAGAGMNIVKGFNFEKGLLELEAGVKYSMADVNRNEETVISVYGIDNINLGNPEIDKTRGTAHVGFDYEHTTGFGVNGKYETMWSDSGDDSRITAGISYRF